MLSNNLKKIRKEKNIGIRELDKISGVSHPIIINIESGKSKNPTINTVKK